MQSTPFEYHRVASIGEAIALLGQFGEDGRVVTGGDALQSTPGLGGVTPQHLIDIRHIPELQGVREEGDVVRIGAAATREAVEQSDVAQHHVPILAEVARRAAGPASHGPGTVGGDLADGDPTAELPPVFLALGAELRAVGPHGERSIRADDFFVEPFATALGPDEVLTQVRVRIPQPGTGAAYERVLDADSGYAVGVAAVVTLGPAGVVRRIRVALAGAGQKPMRPTGVEEALTGKAASAATIDVACRRTTDLLTLADDAAGTAARKADLATDCTRRAITLAVERAARNRE